MIMVVFTFKTLLPGFPLHDLSNQGILPWKSRFRSSGDFSGRLQYCFTQAKSL
jgi:hypothetical protein